MTNNDNNTYEQPRLQLPLPVVSLLEPAKKKREDNNNKVEDTDDDVRKDFEVDFDVNKEKE